jgi:hypothetical protein
MFKAGSVDRDEVDIVVGMRFFESCGCCWEERGEWA